MEQDQRKEGTESTIMAERILRLEERFDRLDERPAAALRRAPHPAWPFTLGCAALALGYLGMGVPLHPYQFLFAGLLLLLAYHRGFLRLPRGPWQWPLIMVNFATMALFFMLVLGGGVRQPLAWLKVPAVAKGQPSEGGSWYRAVVPDYTVQWHAVPGFTDFSFDVTKVQAFLVIVTLAGALFRFQGFASITAFSLLIISIPVYLSFTWDWVVLFLVCGSVSLYLQTIPRPRGFSGPP